MQLLIRIDGSNRTDPSVTLLRRGLRLLERQCCGCEGRGLGAGICPFLQPLRVAAARTDAPLAGHGLRISRWSRANTARASNSRLSGSLNPGGRLHGGTSFAGEYAIPHDGRHGVANNGARRRSLSRIGPITGTGCCSREGSAGRAARGRSGSPVTGQPTRYGRQRTDSGALSAVSLPVRRRTAPRPQRRLGEGARG